MSDTAPERAIAFDYIGGGPLSDDLIEAVLAVFAAFGVTVEGVSDCPSDDLYGITP